MMNINIFRKTLDFSVVGGTASPIQSIIFYVFV